MYWTEISHLNLILMAKYGSIHMNANTHENFLIVDRNSINLSNSKAGKFSNISEKFIEIDGDPGTARIENSRKNAKSPLNQKTREKFATGVNLTNRRAGIPHRRLSTTLRSVSSFSLVFS
jgi:hypothetical protein